MTNPCSLPLHHIAELEEKNSFSLRSHEEPIHLFLRSPSPRGGASARCSPCYRRAEGEGVLLTTNPRRIHAFFQPMAKPRSLRAPLPSDSSFGALCVRSLSFGRWCTKEENRERRSRPLPCTALPHFVYHPSARPPPARPLKESPESRPVTKLGTTFCRDLTGSPCSSGEVPGPVPRARRSSCREPFQRQTTN